MKRPLRTLMLILALLTIAPSAHSAPGGIEIDLYRALLERYTAPVADLARVRVDYAELRREPRWPRLVRGLAGARPAAFTSRPEKMAFWINAYNILAMDLIVRSYPVASIRDLGSWLQPVWRLPAGTVAGRPMTLHEIEHGVLRPLDDPRFHAAIVCASVSCPPLRRSPFEATDLDEQLDEVMRRWLADPDKGARFEVQNGVLVLSRIFDWFEEDFSRDGHLVAALEPSLPQGIRARIQALGHPPEVRYFDYDWRLNDLRAGESRISARFPDTLETPPGALP